MKPITFIHTPFPEKFGVPRQSLLIPEAKGVMSFPKTDFFVEAFRGVEESSHLWLVFEFHLIAEKDIQALVRPPRFLNKKKMGVFATRSPHRPNRLGLSLVKFEKLEILDKEVRLTVAGVDLVSGTPVYDIKPFVPYVDAVKEAKTPFTERPQLKKVLWMCKKPAESDLIEKVIALDPRPGQDKESEEEYGVSVAGVNVRFRYTSTHVEILKISKIKDESF